MARAALGFWPLPNRTPTRSGANNFSGNNDSVLARNIVVAKVDHQLTPNDLFTGRYYINDAGIENQGSFGIPESDPDANFTDVRVQSVLGGYTRIFRPDAGQRSQGHLFPAAFCRPAIRLGRGPGG